MIGTIAVGAGVKTCLEFVFDNPIGKAMSAGALVVGVFMTWLFFHDANITAAAKTEVIADINTQAEKLTDEALKAREPAHRPGAFERLRKGSCTDCNAKAVLPGGETRLH